MALNTYRLAVTCSDRSQENRLVNELMDRMLDISPELSLRREKASQDTLDLGSVIIAIVGTPFALEVVRVLGAWLLKHPEGEIEIETSEPGGGKTTKLRAKGLTANQLAQLIERALKLK